MNALFIELYLDEDVDVLVAELVRAYGFDVLTARDAGQLGREDEDQLAYAVSVGRAVLTHNRSDFAALAEAYYKTGREHYGMMLAFRRTPYEIAHRLMMILNHITADEMKDQVLYL